MLCNVTYRGVMKIFVTGSDQLWSEVTGTYSTFKLKVK